MGVATTGAAARSATPVRPRTKSAGRVGGQAGATSLYPVISDSRIRWREGSLQGSRPNRRRHGDQHRRPRYRLRGQVLAQARSPARRCVDGRTGAPPDLREAREIRPPVLPRRPREGLPADPATPGSPPLIPGRCRRNEDHSRHRRRSRQRQGPLRGSICRRGRCSESVPPW